MIKEIFDAQFKPHESSGKFSISSIGACRRKKFMEMKGRYKEEYSEKTKRTFATGDAFHRLACAELMSKGDLLGFHVVAAEFPIPEHPFLSGRVDQIIADKNGELMVVDVKSCSSWVMNKVKSGEVSDAYINQVQLYLHLLKIKKGYLLFYSKNNGEVEEYEINYDKELCERLVDEVKYFMEFYIANDIIPPPCNGGDFGCLVCFPTTSSSGGKT